MSFASELKPYPWQVDDPIGSKFGYVTEIQYKDAGLLVRRLVDYVSMNGNYLFNISPMTDGTIPRQGDSHHCPPILPSETVVTVPRP